MLYDYHPTPVPNDDEQLKRYVEDELNRLAIKCNGEENLFSIAENVAGKTVNVAAGTWYQMFIGQADIEDIPEGQWDSVLGIWTCASNGVYFIQGGLTAECTGSGSKHWTLAHRINLNGTTEDMMSNGIDDMDLYVTQSYIRRFEIGDTVKWYCDAYQPTPSTTFDYRAHAHVWRLK